MMTMMTMLTMMTMMTIVSSFEIQNCIFDDHDDYADNFDHEDRICQNILSSNVYFLKVYFAD